ncbi:MAG: hypothetical protein Ta2E_10480 [Mycoplasmoidaceae bacterium]|nr:MAG: hypothetical protein Ta2E_10480 [Mycoplasmoidaceae bacterium]
MKNWKSKINTLRLVVGNSSNYTPDSILSCKSEAVKS